MTAVESKGKGPSALAAKAAAYLASLGATPDAVLDGLARQGVKGEPSDGSRCALAVGLSRHLADPQASVCVLPGEAVLSHPGGPDYVPLPEPVRRAVVRFDALKRPDLLDDDATEMEAWRRVFRKGLVPLLEARHLESLHDALSANDPRLVQGTTCHPPAKPYVADRPVRAACLLGWCGWQGEGLETVAEVEEYAARFCYLIGERLGDPTGYRPLLNAFDDWTRNEMVRNLLPELDRALARKKAVSP